MFGRVDFREDGKKKRRETEEGKLFGGCLIGRRRGKKKCDGAWVFFSSSSPKCFRPKLGRKLREGV